MASESAPLRTAVRTITLLKAETGGYDRLPTISPVRMQSLVESTIGNELSSPVSEGKCPGHNRGSRCREFKSRQPD